MRIVVCGSRKWADRATIVTRIAQSDDDAVIITGGAMGADTIADAAARDRGLDRIIVPANWTRHGRAAGPIRNQRMLDFSPDLVIAFRSPGLSAGTDNMIRAAQKRCIPVEIVEPA